MGLPNSKLAHLVSLMPKIYEEPDFNPIKVGLGPMGSLNRNQVQLDPILL